MSLQEKLSSLSNEIEKAKTEEKNKVQEKELEPVRSNIKELEKIKYQLELLLGSLNLKSGGEIGKGMREYSTETTNKFKRETLEIDGLINRNKEALKTIGVESKEQLLENPEFAEDQEIVSYKKSKTQKEDLELSDSALKDRLSTFGIEIDQKNFSYDLAKKGLEEKIKNISKELIQEKIKTPEGREESKKELIEYFDKKIPLFSLSEGEYFDYSNKVFILRLKDYSEIQFNEREILSNSQYGILKLFDQSEWREMEETYSFDIVKESIKEIFKKRIGNISYPHDPRREKTEEYKKMVESKFLPLINSKIEPLFRGEELIYKAEAAGLKDVRSIKDLDSLINDIESKKKDAENTLNEIAKIEANLPDEEVLFIGTHIEVPSANEKYIEFQKETEEREKKLQETEREIQKLETNKPKLFGKEKWNNNLDLLKKEKEELKKLVDRKYYTEENNKNYWKAYIYIPTKEYSYIRKIVENQPKIRANSKEVFNDLKAKLEEITNTKVPESVLKLREEFSDLEEKPNQRF